ncbi:MAG: glycosyltransferase family 2 protein [Flavobacterium sp.]|nr:MAG: glycosyltransferase family 2 protein [Flavobacterium sp.]
MDINVSIILLNYNNSVLTLNCIDSIFEKTPKSVSFEIVIVDNASKYSDYEHLKTGIDTLNLPNVSLYRSRINTGFAAGNMQGVQYAKGQHIALINNDVLLVEDSFTPLIAHLEKFKDHGALGIQPIYEDGEKQVAFGHFDTFATRFFGYWLYEKLNPKKTKRHGDYKVPTETDFVIGSFMFFRAEDFYKVGGLDSNLFLYYEEMDVCKRLKNIGLKSVFIPTINYVHLCGRSTNIGYHKKIELKISHLYIVRKNHGYLQYALLKYLYILIFSIKSLVKPKHFKLALALIKMGAPLANSLKHQQIILEK